MLARFLFRLRSSAFFDVFNRRDPLARGRVAMAASGILSSVLASLTSGIFYTGFLLANDIDIVNITWLSSIPFLMSFFSILSPAILDRFKRRKAVLTAARIAFYTINIAGISLIPLLGLSKQTTYALFVCIVFVSHALNFLFVPGYSVWHLRFIPDRVRANFFSYQMVINAATAALALIISSAIADGVQRSGNILNALIALRFVAYGLAVLEAIVLALPKEYEYPADERRPGIRALLTTPFKHKKFMLTLSIVFAWNMTAFLALTPYDVYILNTVKISYMLISVVNASYILFLLGFSPFWKRSLAKRSWFRTFALALSIHAPTLLFAAFIAPNNYMWLFVSVRIFQHFAGAGLNLTNANMAYVNLPPRDQTSCMSFYVLTANLAAFVGQTLGTLFLAATPHLRFSLFGNEYSNVTVLVLIQMCFCTALIFYVRKLSGRLTPEE